MKNKEGPSTLRPSLKPDFVPATQLATRKCRGAAVTIGRGTCRASATGAPNAHTPVLCLPPSRGLPGTI